MHLKMVQGINLSKIFISNRAAVMLAQINNNPENLLHSDYYYDVNGELQYKKDLNVETLQPGEYIAPLKADMLYWLSELDYVNIYAIYVTRDFELGSKTYIWYVEDTISVYTSSDGKRKEKEIEEGEECEWSILEMHPIMKTVSFETYDEAMEAAEIAAIVIAKSLLETSIASEVVSGVKVEPKTVESKKTNTQSWEEMYRWLTTKSYSTTSIIVNDEE